MEDGNAESIFRAIKELLDNNHVPYNNIIAFAADGANTMMGCVAGVQARLKEICPNIHVQICICHALHLCASTAANELPNVVEQFVRDIYAYFSHSNKRNSELRECQVFWEEKPHKMLKAAQTRWLSLKMTVARVLEHWNSLTIFFQQAALVDNLLNAKTILNALRNPEFKIYLLFLSYILEIINKINVEMQSEGSKVPLIFEKITALYKLIVKNFVKVDSNYLDVNIRNPRCYLELETMYCGAKLEAFLYEQKNKNAITEKEISSFQKHILKFYIVLAEQIKKRFDFTNDFLIFASNFAPSTVKAGRERSIARFVSLFPQVVCDIEEVNVDWQLLLEQDLSNFSSNIDDFWKEVFETKNSLNKPMFPNLADVVKVILRLPHSSACAERGFSSLNLNKTKIRNRLYIKTVSAICINCER